MQQDLRKRGLFIAMLVALALPVMVVGFNPLRVSAGSCAEDTNNLLKNGTMAPGVTTPLGVVSANWKGFAKGANKPIFENAPNEGWDPNGSQYIWRDLGEWDAGVWQKLTNLTPGQTYHFWMVWGQALHDMGGDNARATMMNRQIGVDPTGGKKVNSPNVIWSVPYYGTSGFNRPEWNLYFTATSNKATFFLRAQNKHLDGRNKVFFDTACLFPATGSPTSTPWTPTGVPATATPTFTPSLTPTPTLTPTLAPGVTVEDTSTSISYSGGWTTEADATASDGTFHSATGAVGSTVSLTYAFSGDYVTVRYVGNGDRGRAKVLIDGVSVGVIDQYAPTLIYNLSKTFSGLAPGAHTLKIKNNGGKNVSSTNSTITLDALEAPSVQAGLSGFKFAGDRPTRTPTPRSTPVKPKLIPFREALLAAPTPDDPSVIWDSRLPGLNVSLEPATVSAGSLYWKLIRADYHDPFQHSGDFGSDHNMYYVVTNENGARVAGQKVWQSWPDDAASTQTNSNGIADIPMWANYFPEQGPGPYSGYVDGLPSDVVRGMGLPANNHVSFILYFQKTVKGTSGQPTNTPTPTNTATATRTQTPTATNPPNTATHTPTNAPNTPTRTPTNVPASATPTATNTPGSAVQVDDTDTSIQYSAQWTNGTDAAAINGTFHVARGAKGAPVKLSYTFTGTEITVWYIGYSDRGKVKVMIDGVNMGQLDQYTSAVAYGQSRTYGELGEGTHTIKFKNKGKKNPGSSDSYISLDAFEIR